MLCFRLVGGLRSLSLNQPETQHRQPPCPPDQRVTVASRAPLSFFPSVGDQFIDLSAPPTARALAGAHLADDDDAADGEEGKMISPAHSEV